MPLGALSVVLAALAAGSNALSSVEQRLANRTELQQEPQLKFGPRLLAHLVRRRTWLLGALAMLVSAVLQGIALAIGSLTVVEPILVAELPMTLLLAGWLLRRPVSRRDLLTMLGIAGGLALFLGALGPSGGAVRPAGDLVVLGLVVTAAGIAGLALSGAAAAAGFRAALLGAAAGAGFGLTASLWKLASTSLSGGWVALLGTWEIYVLGATGLASIVLVQAALRSGTLVAAQPGITLLDPLVAVLWGVLLLGEHTRTGPLPLTLAAIGGAAVAGAVLLLVRSPALSDAPAGEPASDVAGGRGRPGAATAPDAG